VCSVRELLSTVAVLTWALKWLASCPVACRLFVASNAVTEPRLYVPIYIHMYIYVYIRAHTHTHAHSTIGIKGNVLELRNLFWNLGIILELATFWTNCGGGFRYNGMRGGMFLF
jgi:hypothetical protein